MSTSASTWAPTFESDGSVSDLVSGHDCFEIGRAAYELADYYHTIFWMQEAYNRVEKENSPTASMTDILEYLSFSLYKQGNVKRALALTKQLTAIGSLQLLMILGHYIAGAISRSSISR